MSFAKPLETSDRCSFDSNWQRLDPGDIGLRVRQCDAGAEVEDDNGQDSTAISFEKRVLASMHAWAWSGPMIHIVEFAIFLEQLDKFFGHRAGEF